MELRLYKDHLVENKISISDWLNKIILIESTCLKVNFYYMKSDYT